MKNEPANRKDAPGNRASVPRSFQFLAAFLAPVFSVALALSVAQVFGVPATARKPRASHLPASTTTPGDPNPTWQEIDRLVREQKFEAAAKAVEAIRKKACGAGNDAECTRALVEEVKLRIALHGYETAVRFLKEETWPADLHSRTTLNLFYAHTLATYLRAYGWEVGQREHVASSAGPVDLKAWTKEQIRAEAEAAYEASWRDRAALGEEPVGRLAQYLDPNTYPERIRGTLRDTLTYDFANFLADTSLWDPRQSNELYKLEMATLLADADTKTGDPEDTGTHPAAKLAAVLGDLESWHAGAREPEAAFEARLERLRKLHQAFSDETARAKVRADLKKRLPAMRDFEWWAMGQATLADMVFDDEPENRIHALDLANRASKAYPNSPGGELGRYIAAIIEAPDFALQAMASDGAGKRSIQVTHKNITTLHFRAYALDLEAEVRKATDYNLLPDQRDIERLLKEGKPAAVWTVDLPRAGGTFGRTPEDYRDHRSFVTPPLSRPGLYVISASAREDFARERNRIASVNFILTDLVLVTRQSAGQVEVTALSGRTGVPQPRATVGLFKYDWSAKGHHESQTRTTDANGSVSFAITGSEMEGPFFLFAKSGDQVALDTNYLYVSPPSSATESTSCLVYTDRSVYRPQQKILWKVVAYRSSSESARHETLAAAAVTVDLDDANGETVESKTVATNAFGTASGEFTIPAGRLLGNWTLKSSLAGQTGVRVEEYKRPTFEASLKDPSDPLRLNRPARLTGEARYYFGLPVTSGTVAWRVTREPQYPWWWGAWGWRSPSSRGSNSGSQPIASGDSALQADGSFEIRFTPEANEGDGASKDVTYRYVVRADVTDEGGETRSADRAFRLGFVAVEASLVPAAGFFRDGVPGEVTITRTDLDGLPRPGEGTWRVMALQQPEHTLLPADQPIPAPEADTKKAAKFETVFETPGDRLRPRWNPAYSPQAVLRQWEDGAERGRGALTHDAKGVAKTLLPELSVGAYRLRYETRDEFGALYETTKEFVVAGGRSAESPAALPLLLLAEAPSVPVGGTARFLALSGLEDQRLVFEVYRGGKRIDRRILEGGKDANLIEIPIREQDRGGFGVTLTTLRDHQFMTFTQALFVPWDDRKLEIQFQSFRDRLRPGTRETWRVKVKGANGDNLGAGVAELLTYMYDRSLDLFAPHHPADPLALYPNRTGAAWVRANLTAASEIRFYPDNLVSLPGYAVLRGDRLKFYGGYAIGGPGQRRMRMSGAYGSGGIGGDIVDGLTVAAESASMEGDLLETEPLRKSNLQSKAESRADSIAPAAPPPPPSQSGPEPVALRSDFSETALWQPHLLTGADGSATIEFTVPDSVTAWNVWVHAVTRDLRAGSVHKEARSVKDLMVRPYLPRFLREGDAAEIKVVVNNAADSKLTGQVTFDILDPETNRSLLADFGLEGAAAKPRPFTVAAGGGVDLSFPIRTPKRIGTVAFKVTASAGDVSDGELRALPILPGRMHLAQSRFAALHDAGARRTLRFADLERNDDASRIDEALVVTLDAQLFYSVLESLPYLVNYPYQCTEQTLNRFLSTGILTSLYDEYPAVAKMAKDLSARETRLETFDGADPNRKMGLEESPWLVEARGGSDGGHGLANVLDPRIAKAEREAALAKLRKAQTAIGAFPWWDGGPPSPYMTLYILHGFSKALEFGVPVPEDMSRRAWEYMHRHYLDEIVRNMIRGDHCWEFVTFVNYVLSNFDAATAKRQGPAEAASRAQRSQPPEASLFTAAERQAMLDYSFKHWKLHSPYLKSLLALTLKRMGRPADAKLVFASVMDSAKTGEDEGTYWAAEDRSWLWYNDTIESHAFALRTLMELDPADARKHGLVQWLFLNKKLNHWKSTRATAEVVYSLTHYLEREGALGAREDATVSIGPQKTTFVFEPDRYTGKKNQVVIPGDKIDPRTMAAIEIEKQSKGFLFASATWHFSTERLPPESSGDFLGLTRRYFKRENKDGKWILTPLAEGTRLVPGDQVEVQLAIRSKHAAEYVHLRDPRPAGLEPENAVSRFKWDLGIGWYEETRDSGTNFFLENLPAGEYPFKYRLRANMAGVFKASPATLQSMYAPEFTAYSSGATITVTAP